MTPEERLLDNLIDMEEAATEAISFLEGDGVEAFKADIMKQRAVAMTFVLIGAAASRIVARFPDIVTEQPQIAWAQIRGMRNIAVHEYGNLDWERVWETVHKDLPVLLGHIETLRRKLGAA